MIAYADLLRRIGRTTKTLRRAAIVAAAIMAAGGSSAHAQGSTCFPSCDERDGRFLSLVGTSLESLAGDIMVFSFRVPSTATAFTLDVFDGETGGMWDKGTNPVIFEVFADPDGNGIADAGETAYPPQSGATMSDNAWSTISIPTSNAARLSGAGPYYYTVRMRLQDPSVPGTWSNFKIRANADILMQTNNFAFAAPLFSSADAAVIYPSFDPSAPSSPASLANSRYDGTWRFFMMVDKARVFGTRPDTAYVDIWDGDMDFGSYDGSTRDTDDPNTPPAPYRPSWATGTTAVSEGVAVTDEPVRDATGAVVSGGGMATGNPADDNISPIYRRAPSINYVIIAPDGAIYSNTNPSGSREWERFSVSLLGGVPMVHDIKASAIPDGIYEVRIAGMDLNNLNAWHSTFQFIGVCPDGAACPQPPEDCTTCPTGDCPGATATKGYWKNHPDAWPVTTLSIGGRMRDQATLLAMLAGTGTDKFNILASQLVAAKLNVAGGAESSCIASTIASADTWIAANESKRPIREGSAWTAASPLATKLDQYNNGLLCAPHRDKECSGDATTGGSHKTGKGKLK